MDKKQFDALSEAIGGAGSPSFVAQLMDAVCQMAQVDHLALDLVHESGRRKVSEGVSVTSSVFPKAVSDSAGRRLIEGRASHQSSAGRKIHVRRLDLNLLDLRCREPEFYLRFGIADGMELQWRNGQASFHLDLYRTHRLGRFSNVEEATLTAAAGLLAGLIELHASMSQLTIATSRQPHDVLQIVIGLLGKGLTPRENAVACRIAAGMGTVEIAQDMGVKPATVVTFRKKAYAKLGIGSQAELFARCFQLLLTAESRSLLARDEPSRADGLLRAV
ncbi:MAG: helix-turn-helix transcriptional regulator [Caulobacteraceae bacterium]